ncbi:MAG: hypothetical protein LKI94_07200 [Sporolactobacillus sp.]|nr:hypothetical protein [Sporolactobacillus sp.]
MRIIAVPLPLQTMVGVLQPFLKIEEGRNWSPLAVFADQRIIEEREPNDQRFVQVAESDAGRPYREALAGKYRQLMRLLLSAYDEQKIRTLSDFIDVLERQGHTDLFERRYFYQFWLILHQRSPICCDHDANDKKGTMLDEALAELGRRMFNG